MAGIPQKGAERPHAGDRHRPGFWGPNGGRFLIAVMVLWGIAACEDIEPEVSSTEAATSEVPSGVARERATGATSPGAPVGGGLVVETLSPAQALQVRAALLPPLAQVAPTLPPPPLPRGSVTKVAYLPEAPREPASVPNSGVTSAAPARKVERLDKPSVPASPPLAAAATPTPRTAQAPAPAVVPVAASAPRVASIPPVERPTPSPSASFRCALPLTEAESARLLKIAPESAEYSDARRCVIRQLKQAGNYSDIKKLVKEQQSQQPMSRYDPLLLLELAEAELMTGGFEATLKASEDARRYLSRAQSATPWVLEARIEEIQGRTYRKQYEQKADVVLLDKAVQRWQDYRSLVAQQDPRRVGLADKELEHLELLRKRHP